MKLDQFDFHLPEELIALYPLEQRDQSRLLQVASGGQITNRKFHELVDLIPSGSALVMNETKVLAAHLTGVRLRGENRAKISLNLHKKISANEWLGFARPAKKIKADDWLVFGDENNACALSSLKARVMENRGGGELLIKFELSGPQLDEQINQLGHIPLPPYIGLKRDVQDKDRQTYQTVYAKEKGSVAAPTAGLHFTDELLKQLEDKGIELIKLTLHVGAGTFLPVKTDDVLDHKMHGEWGRIPPEAAEKINQVKENGGQIIAVGTTSTRLLEAAAQKQGVIAPFEGETDIFMTPGYEFKIVDQMITNFHLPKSTLFMLVSAFSGLDEMKRAYAHAIKEQYRFYSYGDACLLERK